MNSTVVVKSKYRAYIQYDGQYIKATGSLNFLKLIQSKIKQQGQSPEKWTLLDSAKTSDEMMLNYFINKVKNNEVSSAHDEVCHCRMVERDKIEQSIFQGCLNRDEISRTTLAGTGCGSCRGDIEKILNRVLNLSN